MKHFNLIAVSTLLLCGMLELGILSQPSLAEGQGENLRQGLPGRRISGGSRSPGTACVSTPGQPVVALMPKSNLALTLSQHPTFWVSLPAINPDRYLEFGLFDESGELIYQTTVAASGRAELSSFILPETEAPLKERENYRWYLSVICNSESRAEDLMVTGWVQYVQPSASITQQLADTTTLEERLAIYRASELRYEELSALTELQHRHIAQPTASTSQIEHSRIEQQWVALLESLDLAQALAVQP